MKTLVITLLMCLLNSSRQDTDNNIRACGKVLAYRRFEACKNDIDKKDQEYSELGIEAEVNEEGWPWLNRLTALTMYEGRNKRKGIVEECCHKMCSLEELKNYC